jgi:hypothetical protein
MSLMNVRAPAGHKLCRFLRCKEMYYSNEAQRERIRTDPKGVFEGKVFWCNRTHQAEGPDANRCGVDECGPGRTCYDA